MKRFTQQEVKETWNRMRLWPASYGEEMVAEVLIAAGFEVEDASEPVPDNNTGEYKVEVVDQDNFRLFGRYYVKVTPPNSFFFDDALAYTRSGAYKKADKMIAKDKNRKDKETYYV